MREIHDHKVNGLNEHLQILVTDVLPAARRFAVLTARRKQSNQ